MLLDGSRPLPLDLQAISAPLAAGACCILVVNKADLTPAWRIDELADWLGGSFPGALAISGQNGAGVRELERRIMGELGFERWIDDSPAVFTARQNALTGQAVAECRSGASAVFAQDIDRLIGRFSDAGE